MGIGGHPRDKNLLGARLFCIKSTSTSFLEEATCNSVATSESRWEISPSTALNWWGMKFSFLCTSLQQKVLRHIISPNLPFYYSPQQRHKCLLFFLDLGWAVGHLHENIFCCEYLTPEVKAEKSNVLIFLSCSEWHREEPCATFTYDSYWWVTWWVRENSVYFLDGDLWGSGSAVTSDKLYLGLSLLIRTVPGLMQHKWLFAYVKI